MQFKIFLTTILIFLILSKSIFVYAQNLVGNGEFTWKNIPPNNDTMIVEQYAFVENWFNTNGEQLTDKNGFNVFSAKKVAFNGSGGLLLFDLRNPESRSYLQTPFLVPLERGKMYEISFQMKFPVNYEWNGIANKEVFGLYLSNEKITQNNKNLLEIAQKDKKLSLSVKYFNEINKGKKARLSNEWANNYTGRYSMDTSITKKPEKWHTYYTTFEATGEEKFLVFGNFCKDEIYLKNLSNLMEKNKTQKFVLGAGIDNLIVRVLRNTRE